MLFEIFRIMYSKMYLSLHVSAKTTNLKVTWTCSKRGNVFGLKHVNVERFAPPPGLRQRIREATGLFLFKYISEKLPHSYVIPYVKNSIREKFSVTLGQWRRNPGECKRETFCNYQDCIFSAIPGQPNVFKATKFPQLYWKIVNKLNKLKFYPYYFFLTF